MRNSVKTENKKTQSNLKKILLEVAVLTVSAFVYSAAFPGFISEKGLGFLALVCIIPVFMVIDRAKSVGLCAFYGYFFGYVFYVFFNYWLSTFHALAIVLVPLIKGFEMMVLFIALKLSSRWFPKKAYLLQTACWVAYAYISQNWFAGYPYGTICYALYRYRVLVQIADIAGIWPIIALMIFPQALAAQTLLTGGRKDFLRNLKKETAAVIVYAVLVLASVVYGIVMLSTWNGTEPDRNWKVAVVQHNADTWKGGLATYKNNFNTMKALSLQALSADSEIEAVIWSETAFVPSVAWHTNYPDPFEGETGKLVDRFVEFGSNLGIPLITGNPEGVLSEEGIEPYTEDGSDWNRKDYNTVLLFDDGHIKATYRKQHLVPFTEHFPYEKQLPWLYNLLLANDYNWWEKGNESTVFTVSDGITFGTPICFEDVFGDLVADMVLSGANVIVNLTNDSWSGSADAERQHATMATFRSIENRKSTVRSTNSGITCVISPTGEILDELEPFICAYGIFDVPVYESGEYTLYTRYGDWFALLCKWGSLGVLAAGAVCAALRMVRAKKER